MLNFEIEDTTLKEVKIIIPKIFEDYRGYFMEVFNADSFQQLGIPSNFVQMNQSQSRAYTVRGLHFQWNPPMGKLMRVIKGEAYLVAVDIRKNSPTLGQWYGGYFSAFNKKQLWAPGEFARGFCSLEDSTEVQYLITGTYNPECESEILWNDEDIGITWPTNFSPILSKKDEDAQTFQQWLDSENSNNILYEK
ncbi:MAG: dTDP-4-dehydrorhamnose 3,5-epimerase [Nitrosopumilus sp.]